MISFFLLDAFWVNVGVLIACLLSAGNIYVLAQRYDADPKRVSAAILLSTIVSEGRTDLKSNEDYRTYIDGRLAVWKAWRASRGR
jgi:hypothetical protein